MQATINPSTTPVPGQYWEWRGHKIYYVKAGNKHPQRPPLLLVHGFGASTDHWRKNISGLCEDFEVYAIDLLGYGRSAKPKLPYCADVWRDQLHDFITEVIGEKAVIAGNSLGGYASLCVAAQCPDAAAGLVLLNSAGSFSKNPPASEANTNLKSTNQLQQVFGDIGKWIFQQPLTHFIIFQYIRQRWVIRQTLEKVYLDKTAITEQLIDEIQRPSGDEGALDVFASMFTTSQGGEKVDTLLQQLTCPLLLLWGEGDPWVNARDRSQQFRRYYPELSEYFLNAGHCPHDEVPDQLNPLFRDWVLGLANT
jgi:pimeloyl-ACP methyl ester carboxylesterase